MRSSHPARREPSGETGWTATQNSNLKTQNSNQAGFTLAAFVMVIAVMAIMIAVAVEIVSFQAQREKEAELIFRGQQYVEGIRLYRQKYGRYPMRMKELWEADPRVLRQKWIDPITGTDRWGVIFEGQEGRELQVPGTGRKATPTRTPIFDRDRQDDGEKVGPIIGVYSLSTETSIKVYEGRTQYDMWKFVLKPNQGTGPRVDPNERDDLPDTRTRVPEYTGTPNR